jgi:hypothetical protein
MSDLVKNLEIVSKKIERVEKVKVAIMNIHKPIVDLVNFYAQELNDETATKVVGLGEIENESEAVFLLGFCEKMFELSIKYEAEGKSVLGMPAKVYDAEKAYSILSDLVSEQGFDHLIEN